MSTVTQQGAVLLLFLLALVVASMGLALLQASRQIVYPPYSTALQRSRLLEAREALILWSGARLTHASASMTPPGFLPYPDRNGDGDYDGTSDCLSGTGLAHHRWRVGKLPWLGERLPCESRDRLRAEASVSAGIHARRSMAALRVNEHDNELLWYAASIHVLDDDRLGSYPDISVMGLMQRDSGWLTVCDQNGQLLSRDAAFVVIAPGPALQGQRRRSRAPAAGQFLDAFPLQGSPPCNAPDESNADDNAVFIAFSGTGSGPPFNDQLAFVGRREYVSRLAIAQARHLAGLLQQQASFPWAALPDSLDGRCILAQRTGRLPLQDGDACTGLRPAPPYLTAGGTDYASPQYVQLTYARSALGDRASLHFSHCAIRFTFTRQDFSYAPSLC